MNDDSNDGLVCEDELMIITDGELLDESIDGLVAIGGFPEPGGADEPSMSPAAAELIDDADDEVIAVERHDLPEDDEPLFTTDAELIEEPDPGFGVAPAADARPGVLDEDLEIDAAFDRVFKEDSCSPEPAPAVARPPRSSSPWAWRYR